MSRPVQTLVDGKVDNKPIGSFAESYVIYIGSSGCCKVALGEGEGEAGGGGVGGWEVILIRPQAQFTKNMFSRSS